MSKAQRNRTQQLTPRQMVRRDLSAATLLLALIGLLSAAGAHAEDDTALFQASVPPNIMIMADNSGSMHNLVWHSDYGANKNQTQCQAFRNAWGSSTTSLRYYPNGRMDTLYTKDSISIRYRENGSSATPQSWEPPIYLGDGTQVWWDKDQDGVQDAGEDDVYHRTCDPDSTTDITAHCSDHNVVYDRWGVPMTNASGNPFYYYNEADTGGSNRASVFARVRPVVQATAAGLNHLDFGFHSSVCGVSTTGFSLPPGDPAEMRQWGDTITIEIGYVDFLFSSVGAAARQAVLAPTTANAGLREYSACLGKPAGSTYEIHRRTRTHALELILETVVCEVNQANVVRFGLSQFRTDGSGADPNGGYAVLPIQDFKQSDGSPNVYTLHGQTVSHEEHLTRVIGEIGPDSWTPLGETLFQVYTYFMSREKAKLPYGRNSSGTENSYQFPVYSYDAQQPCKPATTTCGADEVGGYALTLQGNGDANAAAPPSPVQHSCQKNFVLIITDGGSWGDLFNQNAPTDVTRGYADFRNLIGDHYTADTETECCYDDDFIGTYVSADVATAASSWALHSRYLDDIAYFMNRWDFLPDETDFPGVQTLDVYTVGFSMEGSGAPAEVLAKTAANGNGLYFESSDADQLATDIVKAINDMVSKAQAFTSATVPASRTTDSNNFYSSYFIPRDDSPFWDGHLKNFKFTAAGDILTNTNTCAVGTDPAATPPCTNTGVLRTGAEAVWDAAISMPTPALRKLFYGTPGTSIFAQPADWDNVIKDDLGLVADDLTVAPYDAANQSGITDTDLSTLAGLIRDNLKGCQFGTSCTARTLENGTTSILGDIFHSNPVVVGPPNSGINDISYRAFAAQYRYRDRVLYAGSNDGFLHGFHAGDWDGNATPPGYDRGTGTELFGFMPNAVTKSIKSLPVANPMARGYYAVDGSPVISDVWFYRSIGSGGALGATDKMLLHPPYTDTTAIAEDKQRWRTVVMGGLRQGGNSYYALDVSDPADASYPRYLWEFPCGATSGSCSAAENSDTWDAYSHMGQTWSEPVITRVRVEVVGSSQPYGHERWVAIFGGGYSPEGDPNNTEYDADPSAGDFSPRGRAIFMVDLTTGKVLAKKYFTESDYSSGGTQIGFSDMKYGFASSPAVFDLDFDGFADVVYIGDLGGNLWKWVITAVGHDPINNVSSANNVAQPNWPFGLFFRANTSDTSYDAGTGTWSSGIHFNSFFFPPTGVLRRNTLLLALGSAERANPTAWDNDGLPGNNNRFYVMKDSDPRERATETPASGDLVIGGTGPALKESHLQDITSITPNCTDLHNNYKGYYIVARDAEKFLTRSLIFLGKVLTGSYTPSDPYSGDLCETIGAADLYIFGVDCGSGQFTPANGHTGNDTPDKQRRTGAGSGVPTRPRISVGDINQDGGGGANRAIVVTSDGGITMEDAGDANSSGVDIRTWRER